MANRRGKQQIFEHDAPIIAAEFSPNNNGGFYLALPITPSGWDIHTGDELQQLEGHNGPQSQVAISSDGQRAITVALDSIARVWDLDGRQELGG